MNDLRPNSEISDGIHWLKDRYVNNYIIEYEDDLILIDAALSRKAKGIIRYIKSELESRNISKVLLTHHHVDHTGGLHHLYTTFKPRMFASKEDIPIIHGEKKGPLPNNIFLKPLFFIIRPMMTSKSVTGVEIVSKGDIVDGLEVHPLPGHTSGSIGFLKSKAIFPGDAAATGSKGNIKIGPRIVTESMEQARASFKSLGLKELDMLLPGHGTPVLENASERIKDTIEKMV